MDRSRFGAWGAELDDADFAKALGVMGMHNAVDPWGDPPGDPAAIAERIGKTLKGPDDPVPCRYFTWSPEHWSEAYGARSARNLCTAWDSLRGSLHWSPKLKLELNERARSDTDPAGAGWIVDQLRHPAVGASSVYFSEPARIRNIDWHWPVRVGLLTGDALSAYDVAAGEYTVRRLTRRVDLLGERGTVDLLWITGDLGYAVDAIERSPHAIHAHAVAVTGGEGGLDWAGVTRAKERIAELTQAQAVIVTDSPSAGWLNRVVEQLAHDNTLDVAVNNSGGILRPIGAGPFLWSADPLIRSSRISNFSHGLLRHAAYLDPNQPLMLDPETAGPLALPPGLAPAGLVLQRFGSIIDNIGWVHEYNGASLASGLGKAIEEAAPAASPGRKPVSPPRGSIAPAAPGPPPPCRFLQVAAFVEHDNGRQTWMQDAFACGFHHRLEVEIGPERLGRLALPERFPEQELPPSASGGHLLTVTFFEPQLMEQPQLSTLFLPPAGATAPCHFRFFVPEGITEIRGRVTVFHENRVLQTGVVVGPVRYYPAEYLSARTQDRVEEAPANPDPPSFPAGIQFVISGAVQRAIADLDQRSRFDAALVLNHIGERPGVQGTSGNQSGYMWLDDVTMNAARKDIEKALDTGDWDYAQYNGLYAPGTTKLLRLLAIKGSDIYVSIGKRLPEAVRQGKRLQVVMAKDNARFPVEFTYEYNPPALTAPVCPHAADALRNGACSADCKATAETPAPVVCPLGFWALNRVLEWHAFEEQAALAMQPNAAGRIDIDRAPRSAEVPLGGGCLFGYSKKIDEADKDCIPNFKTRAQSLSTRVDFVDSWKVWKTQVGARDPSILALLVHTKESEYGTMLEMGPPSEAASQDESLLLTSYVTREYVIGPHIKGSPIVLLLGCTTANAKVAFQSVAAAFESRGEAGIIVATSNLIYGPKAVDVAEMFLKQVAAVQDGQTFGDVMLAVRRAALADGIAMILCLSAYGDADWKLVRN